MKISEFTSETSTEKLVIFINNNKKTNIVRLTLIFRNNYFWQLNAACHLYFKIKMFISTEIYVKL